MTHPPRVSIIMPVYNALSHLRQAVESVLAQTYRDFEFLVFDDGSTDGSREALEEYARRDERIALSAGEHRDYLHWLNTGLEQARGQYVARMDADDVALPERLERQVEFLDANPRCAALGTQVLKVDEDGDPYDRSRNPLSHDEIDRAHMQGGGGGARICHPTLMLRRERVLAVGKYRAEFHDAEDFDLYLRLAECGWELANLPEALLKYRIHSRSVGTERRANQLDVIERAVREAHQRRGLPAPVDIRSNFPAADRAGGRAERVIAIATHNGYWRTARKHAWLALRRRPWSPQAWRTAARMTFGR